ncbi:MAG: NAD+ synthase [Alphaproteobacteria bacterium]|nr:NAD+ synthase [Alphaproteobacteria bacterium SS10]
MAAVDQLRIGLAQINPTVGDLPGNLTLLREARSALRDADLVITPELSVAGYFPEDLIDRPGFTADCMAAVEELAGETADGGPAIVVGSPWHEGDQTYNAVLLLDAGRIAGKRFKHHLPNYGVFDDQRNFVPGDMQGPVNFRGVPLGLTVCEDIWFEDLVETLEESGAEIIIATNGSPYEDGRTGHRIERVAVPRVSESGLPLVYVNQVGGQDEVVYDGASFVLNADCRPVHQLPSFETSFRVTEWRRDDAGKWQCSPGEIVKPPEGVAATYQAVTLGLRDYITKNGFPGVVLGLSGGIDSALSAAIAVDALGAERVHGILMPSPYSSDGSIDDSKSLAEALGIRHDMVAIGPGMDAVDTMLGELFAGTEAGVTEENIQSRLRGLTLMAISNKFGAMVLTTGNKSEMAVGYATLYGDMSGGFNALKDVYKTRVYEMARWRNAAKPADAMGPEGIVIPVATIEKPPSAELRPDQTDQDSLPDYDVLDAILMGIIEGQQTIEELTAAGHDRETVIRVWQLLERSEYKRRQSAPGVKVSPRAFGRERRYPITNGYRADMLAKRGQETAAE